MGSWKQPSVLAKTRGRVCASNLSSSDSMAQGQAYVVEAVQQAVFAERVDVEVWR